MIDNLILRFDRFLRTVAVPHEASEFERARQVANLPARDDAALTETERRHAAGLMRVNHAGEVAAQALYEGQALFARDAGVRAELEHAAKEERDHLVWTQQRLQELNARTSVLNPFWYLGSFAIGATSAALSDKASLSFLKATENQVETHLTSHLASLPDADTRSRAIVAAMRDDEIRHAQTAVNHGGEDPPLPVRVAMKLMSKVMTTTAYRL